MTQIMTFRNEEANHSFEVTVHDKFPQMGDTHIEGRRYVEVSVEMFVELIAEKGYVPVVPDSPVKKTLEAL